jgi:hypothetical protein
LVTTVQLHSANAIAASCISTTDMTRPLRRSSWQIRPNAEPPRLRRAIWGFGRALG